LYRQFRTGDIEIATKINICPPPPSIDGQYLDHLYNNRNISGHFICARIEDMDKHMILLLLPYMYMALPQI
jgi:hypothetical protein